MDKKVFLQDLADGLARRKNISKRDAETFVRSVFEIVEDFLLTEQLVKVKGIGTFKLITVDSRESININTGERITIDRHTKITFTPDKTLSDHVNRPFADFETVVLNENTKTEEMERIELESVIETLTSETVVEEEPVVEAEPVVEVKNADALEPTAKPELETTSETEPIVESQPLAEPQPLAESKSVSEPEPVAVSATGEKQPTQTESTISSVPPVADSTEDKKGGRWVLWLLILLLALVLCWFFMGRRDGGQDKTEAQPVNTEKQMDTTIEKADSVEVENTTASAKESTIDIETLVAEYPQIENGEYWIVGTKAVVILERGDDLTKLALEHYGDKRLINYIIKYNHLTAAKASNLFVGAEVKIPELRKRE